MLVMDQLNQTLAALFCESAMIEIKQKPVDRQRSFFNEKAEQLYNMNPKPATTWYDQAIPLKGRTLKARVYEPSFVANEGVIVFFHGGGWMLHNLDVYHLFCLYLADRAKTRLISVAYRLAPENPYPAGVNDACASVDWIIDHANNLGIDPGLLVIAGDSAGGNLTSVVCHERALAGQSMPAAQVLVYPSCDLSSTYSSQHKFTSHEYSLTPRWYRMMYENYLNHPEIEIYEPQASPLLYKDFSRQPKTLMILAGQDPLKDEGIAYADRLKQAGVAVDLKVYPTMTHGFVTFIRLVDEALDAVNRIGQFCFDILPSLK
jgi:pimeloyl-[acyl-carrier protein] methyl ester esterase